MHPARFLILLFCLSALAAADPSSNKPLLANLFGDHAVLQRDRPVTVWGWADAGSAITVSLSGPGLASPVLANATAGSDGRWQASLPPQRAGGPYVLGAETAGHSSQATDILIGDVWLCTGQSNMEFPLNGATDATAEKASANWPRIRHLAAGRLIAGEPQATTIAKWTVCTPQTAGAFTAVGYFFARKLHQDLDVPIGLVNTSYGGTRAEHWTSAEALATLPAYAEPARLFHELFTASQEQSQRTGKDYDTLVRAWYETNDPGSAGTPARWSDPATVLGDDWSDVTLPARLKQAKAVPNDFTGTVWLRRDFDVPAEAAGKAGMLFLIRVKDIDSAWINGRNIGDSESVNWFRKHRVPAGLLHAGRNTIAVRLVCFEGECGLTGNEKELAVTPEGLPPIALAGGWKLHRGTAFADAPPMPVRFDRVPGATSLYNGMIAPLLPLTVAGAIWYQGESNTDAAYNYRTLLPTMIRDWRTRFAQPEMPFLIVQLPNHMGRGTKPENSAWAELREAQALAAREVPNCGLAVTIDIGEALDVHPHNKQDVGLRLALLAEAQVHHLPVAASGPRFRAQSIEGSSIRLAFDADVGLAASDGKPLCGFAIAGADRRFSWATARIDGTTIVVSAPEVPQPVAVRYAWANNPACNLSNASGLPASPFRSDDWPGTTWPR
jgi:sialate O-acetylesterase